MAHWLEKYRDCEVEIQYLTDNNIYKDRGRLLDVGDGWMELLKGSGETFLIPTTAIRLIKLISLPETPANRLLRPAAAPETEIEQIATKGTQE